MNKLYMKSCCPNQYKTVGLKQRPPIRPNNINQPQCGSVFNKAATASFMKLFGWDFSVRTFLMSVLVFQDHKSFVPENRW